MSEEVRDRALTFGELVHTLEGPVPAHTHNASFYHLVLDGKYEESSPHGRISFQPFSSAFTHSDSKHDGWIHGGGARLFTVEIGDAWIKRIAGDATRTGDSQRLRRRGTDMPRNRTLTASSGRGRWLAHSRSIL